MFTQFSVTYQDANSSSMLKTAFFLKFRSYTRLAPQIPEHISVLIELDGHDFHEKTKEQVIYRNKRDRILEKYGFVYHISGSEIYNNISDCIFDLDEYLTERAIEIINGGKNG